jgi:nucleotide-binding universal stress UspA family protein
VADDFDWPRYPRILVAIDETPAAAFALRHEQPFDMLCLGARGRGRVAGALLGWVSTAVLHHSPVPVAVPHPQRDEADQGL